MFGSSPRVWGALVTGTPSAAATRLIPTCVGSTVKSRLLSPRAAAHPHVCGEHMPTVALHFPPLGSSPRVWGALADPFSGAGSTRLIPTCVGSTRSPTEFRLRVAGSSPRVWGAPSRFLFVRLPPRLIPTCVGSTCSISPAALIESAHPHVCGEHLQPDRTLPLASGSSPRVWGARYQRRGAGETVRLIPTCVGSTQAAHTPKPGPAAHPHVCGEHVL